MSGAVGEQEVDNRSYDWEKEDTQCPKEFAGYSPAGLQNLDYQIRVS